MSISRREAIVGALAGLVAPKLPTPFPVPRVITSEWSWVEGIDVGEYGFSIITLIIDRQVQDIRGIEDKKFIEVLREDLPTTQQVSWEWK